MKAFAIAFTLLATAATAQTGSTTTPAPVAASTVDPAPTALTPKQIERMQAKLQDWPQLGRYRAENASLPAAAAGEKRVVFLGDSITDAWGRRHGKFFPEKHYINRGISGQTTGQMLVRFEEDVLALHPAVVVLLAGTNDFAQNNGPELPSEMQDNFRAIVALAKAAHVRVVLCSVLPATRFGWHPGINASADIRTFNVWLKQFAKDEGAVYVDYYSPLVNPEGGMKAELTTDGAVHPNDAGYAVMEPLAEAGIEKALTQ